MTNTNHGEEIRTLFDGANLNPDHPTRDLIGPAIAWGRHRQRYDRLAIAGGIGALTAIAIIGTIALRPGTGSGSAMTIGPASTVVGPQAGSATPTGSSTSASTSTPPTPPPHATKAPADIEKLSKTDTVQQLQQAMQDMLPTGFSFAPQAANPMLTTDQMGILTGPSGTSSYQIVPSGGVGEPGPGDKTSFVPHQASAANPYVTGSKHVPGGTVTITSLDVKGSYVAPASMFTDPSGPNEIAANRTDYTFIPDDPTQPKRYLYLYELTTEIKMTPPDLQQQKTLNGFNKNGPVLSPEQFATFASNPNYTYVDKLIEHLKTFGQ